MSLRLAEWQAVSPVPGSPTENVCLGTDPSVLDLARRLTGTGILEVLELRTGLLVRSTSYVGRVRLGDIEITVVPKLPTNALLKLLRYAYGLRDLRLFPSTNISTQATGLQDILVWQLIEEVEELLERGLRRAYLRREEALSSLRGRIDFRTLAAQGSVQQASLPCIHHHRDENSLVNRVLLAGLKLSSALDVDGASESRRDGSPIRSPCPCPRFGWTGRSSHGWTEVWTGQRERTSPRSH
jgi:5-methylcytosine-specific restriction enzyme subunit McrC